MYIIAEPVLIITEHFLA